MTNLGIACGSSVEVCHKIASGKQEIESAFSLIYRAYVRSGLIPPNRFGMRVMPHHLLPTTDLLIGHRTREVTCTLTLVRDGELGLPMESTYGTEVARRRECGLRLSEASCLADQVDDKQSLRGLVRIMALLAQCAKTRGMDQILIAVNPRHEGFYSRFLGFERFAGQRPYRAVRNLPAVAMALVIEGLEERNRQAHRRLFGSWFSPEELRPRPLAEEVRRGLEPVVAATCGFGVEVPRIAAAA